MSDFRLLLGNDRALLLIVALVCCQGSMHRGCANIMARAARSQVLSMIASDARCRVLKLGCPSSIRFFWIDMSMSC